MEENIEFDREYPKKDLKLLVNTERNSKNYVT